jgi:ABC-type Fe3+/spermidine/putrescine transport system ATPase subunit
LNTQKLVDLIQKNQSVALHIKGKKVIFLLGPTGVGKTTLVHFLAGSKFIKFADSCYDNFYEPVNSTVRTNIFQNITLW